MNNKDYTSLYNELLKGINKYDAGDNLSLIRSISNNSLFRSLIDKYGKARISKEITRALLNMKEDGLIRATVKPVQSLHYLITFNGLTTAGHNYLSVILEPRAMRKVKEALHSEGIPLTPQSVSRFIGKLFS